MEILTTANVEGKVLNLQDKFDIGNGIYMVINELFEIDGNIYISSTTENHAMVTFNFDNIGLDPVTPNRYINHATVWVRKNAHLFT